MKIREASEVIEEGGLAKTAYYDNGSHCIIGGLLRAHNVFTLSADCKGNNSPIMLPAINFNESPLETTHGLINDAKAISEVIQEQYPERAKIRNDEQLYWFEVITYFNDDERTSKEDVLRVMDKAAVEAGE